MQLPPFEITDFAIQNWIITPVALAVNETRPHSILQQKWQVVVSGVGIPNLKSVVNNDWTGELVTIHPRIDIALRYAVNRFSIPVPVTTPYIDTSDSGGIKPVFRVEQYVIYAALGSILAEHTAVNAGFSANDWTPLPYKTLTDPTGHAPTIHTIFDGIGINLAVSDINAVLYRVNYHITLIGTIVFVNFNIPVIP